MIKRRNEEILNLNFLIVACHIIDNICFLKFSPIEDFSTDTKTLVNRVKINVNINGMKSFKIVFSLLNLIIQSIRSDEI